MKLFSALYNGLMNFENNFCCIPYIAKLGVGVQFPAKTSIIRRENELFVISPGPLEAEAELLNEYKLNFISPNNFHHFHLKAMQQRFPEAKFYGGMRAKKQCGVDLQPLKNLEGLDFLKIEGNDLLGERVFYHPESKHLITTDIVFNMHHKMNPATRIATTMAGTYHKLATSRLVLMTMDDRGAYRSSLQALLNWDFETVVVNHGDNISKEEFKSFLYEE